MRLRPEQINGYYSVLDSPSRPLALSLLASSRIMQARRKPATSEQLEVLAACARDVTAMVGALLVVNDSIELAHRVGADGVHLGQDDVPLRAARRRTDLFIGISTHDRAELERALEEEADYVAYGPVFVTTTKENPDATVGLDGLAEAVSLAGPTPLVAIGGITIERAALVRQTGASAACVISAVNASKNVRESARALSLALSGASQSP